MSNIRQFCVIVSVSIVYSFISACYGSKKTVICIIFISCLVSFGICNTVQSSALQIIVVFCGISVLVLFFKYVCTRLYIVGSFSISETCSNNISCRILYLLCFNITRIIIRISIFYTACLVCGR